MKLEVDKNKLTNEVTNQSILKLQQNREKALIAFISVTYVNIDKNKIPKLKWYLTTADLIINNDSILTQDEKNEFIRLHLHYVSLININGITIPLDELLSKAKENKKLTDYLTNPL